MDETFLFMYKRIIISTLWMLGNFLKKYYIVVCFIKPLNYGVFFMGNDGLSSKQVVSQASRRVIRWLAWIQPVCIVPALKGLSVFLQFNICNFFYFHPKFIWYTICLLNNLHLRWGPTFSGASSESQSVCKGFQNSQLAWKGLRSKRFL